MKIKIYHSSVEKFIESLEETTIAKVLRTIDLLKKFESKLGPPHSKPLRGGLFELRIRGSQEVRIFYTFHKSNIILLHGFIKKSQKIPLKEIKVAQKRLSDLT